MVTVLGLNVRDNLDNFLDHFSQLTTEDRYCRFFHTTTPSAIRDWLMRVADSAANHTFIVEEDGFGRYDGIAQLAVDTSGNFGDIAISVLPNRRGQGTAKALVAESINKARLLGLRKVTFQCETGNQACRRLFEGLGFNASYDPEQGCISGHLLLEVDK